MAELIDTKLDHDFDFASTANFLVFEVTFTDGTVKYYKKTGYADSYGGRKWSGPLTEVRATTQTVTAYEPV